MKNFTKVLLNLVRHDVLPATRFLMGVCPIQADNISQKTLSKAMLANNFNGTLAPQSRQFQPPVPHDMHEAVTFHSSNCLRNRGARVSQSLDNSSAKRRNTVFFKLKNRLEIHFGGIDQIAHDSSIGSF